MPEFHQPGEAERRRAETSVTPDDTVGDWAERVPLETLRERAARAGVAGASTMDAPELVDALRRARPASVNDPNAPDRPRT
jgi:hypothetical protein